MISKICGIGAGYVGGPTLAIIAKFCPEIQVTVVDKSPKVIEQWNSDVLPIYEPGLHEVVREVRGRNLFFTTDMDAAIDEADMIFISVDTPTKKYGMGQGRAPNLTNLEAAARHVAKVSRGPKVVVEKSTVPVMASEAIARILTNNHLKSDCMSANGLKESVVLSNPEFLAEGTAIQDLKCPDRILIGGDEKCESGRLAIEMLRNVYMHWVPPEKILVVSAWSSELSKLAANAFLAQRISSINAISALCEKTKADIRQVAKAIGSDSRIGPKFLKPSLGFGGSCFRKDILNLVYISECLHLPEIASYWYSVLQMNEYQQNRFVRRIISRFNNTLHNKRIAVFGFAFKADTHDTRESQAIPVCGALLDEKANVAIYDPKAQRAQIISDLLVSNSQETVEQHVSICSSPQEAVTDAYAIVICTEWKEFTQLDYKQLYGLMKENPLIFDGRVLLDYDKLKEIGFKVEAIGIDTSESSGINGHAR